MVLFSSVFSPGPTICLRLSLPLLGAHLTPQSPEKFSHQHKPFHFPSVPCTPETDLSVSSIHCLQLTELPRGLCLHQMISQGGGGGFPSAILITDFEPRPLYLLLNSQPPGKHLVQGRGVSPSL